MRKAIIKTGASLSTPVDVGDSKVFGLLVPAGWDSGATSTTFQASHDGKTWFDLASEGGDEIEVTVAGGASIALVEAGPYLAPWRFLKIRSGTATSAVNQAGDTKAACAFDFGTDKTLTFTSGVQGEGGNGILVQIDNADGDSLAVTKDDGNRTITVKLAAATGSNNAAAAIEALVQALSTVGDLDVSGMTVEGSTEYNSAPPTSTKAARIFNWGARTLTFTSGVAGAPGNKITLTFETAANDTLAVTNPTDTYNILIKLANATASKNSAAAIQTAVRALTAIGPSGSTVAVSAMAVAGNTAYNSAPAGPVKASKAITVANGKTLTFGSGVAGKASNAIKITIVQNSEDELAVTAAGDTITIKLAKTTGASNAAADIQTAIRAIDGGTVAGINITGFTVAGNSAYNSAPITDLGEGITVDGVPLEGGAISVEKGLFVDIPLVGGKPPVKPVTGALDGGKEIELILALKD